MSRRKLRITLTEAEARNLLYAVGNTADHPDVFEAVLPCGHERAACNRAIVKIARELYPIPTKTEKRP